MEYLKSNEAVIEEDDDGGWVDTHHNMEGSTMEQATAEDEPAQEMKADDMVCLVIFL